MMNLLAIVPAYNESANIASVIAEIISSVPGISIVVIDDGSRDNTAQIATRAGAFVLQLPHNLGIGGAVQTGLRFAMFKNADYVIRLDGDGQHPASQIPILLESVMKGDADITIGSRFCRGANVRAVSFPRRVGIFVFCLLTTVLSGQKVTDPTSGFMVMNSRVVAFLVRNISQDYPEADARVMLTRGGFKVQEIYTQMRERQGGLSSITPVRAFYYVFKVSLSVFAARSRKMNIPISVLVPDLEYIAPGTVVQENGDKSANLSSNHNTGI